jgi:putative ABC transport system permease protein
MMAERFIRALLRAYPVTFRHRFGAGMAEALERDHALARRSGSRALVSFWVITVAQAVWFGLIARALANGELPSISRPPLRRRLASALTLDLRDGTRALAATPIVTIVATLSLALGIGANLALFAVANGLLLKPLPVRDPEHLVLFEHGSWTNPIWERIRDAHAQLFDGAFAWSNERFDLAAGGTKDLVEGAYASGAVFEVLGVPAFVGRTFTVADDLPGGGPDGPVAMISHALWQRRFGGAPDAIGRPINIDRVPFTIVGVMPPGFFGPEVGRAWQVVVPLGTEANIKGKESSLQGRSVWWLEIIAKLKDGATPEQTNAALAAVHPQIRDATRPAGARDPDRFLTDPLTVVAAPGGRSTLRTRYTQPLRIMMAVVATVLLIACANIANLLLARAAARRHELSVRLALGASRWRIMRQLMAESVMLASAGTVLGLLVAIPASAALLQQFGAGGQSPFVDLSLDWRVAIVTVGVACATALLFGVAPALGVSQVAPGDALKEQGRAVAGDRRVSLRNALVVAQVALSLTLIVSAGLFVRTFVSLVHTPLGFDPAQLTVMTVDLQRSRTPSSDRGRVYEQLRQTAAALPTVENVGASMITPVSGSGWNAPVETDAMPVATDTSAKDGGKRKNVTWVNAISPDWFATYRIRLLAGRSFAAADRTGASTVAIVNEAFVERFFAGQNPLGRLVKAGQIAGPGMDSFEVVGVVGNAIYRSARAGTVATMYVPLAQAGGLPANLGFTLRTTTPDPQLHRELADAFQQIEPAAAFTFRRMDDLVGASVAQERLLALLSAGFGAIAVLLAALGLYGVTCYWVSRRRPEIGIRMALGANRRKVAQLVMRRVASVLMIGTAAGLVISVWATRFVASLLFGLDAHDPSTFAAGAATLLAVGTLAGWLPARRAAREDPMHVLRNG